MDTKFAYYLKQPCINRNVTYGGFHDDYALLDGHRFYTIHEAEDYLESKPRIDLPTC